jgi:hypothetical protein
MRIVLIHALKHSIDSIEASASGPCIDAGVRDPAAIRELKPNKAMIEEAFALAGPTPRIGLLATFDSMPPEFAVAAPMVAQVTGKHVLTTPDSAVRKLRRLLLTRKAA